MLQHCFDCGKCVRKLDHHCWWLGNCVGAGNHRLFLSYLTCQTVLIWSFGITIACSASQAKPVSPPLPALSGVGAVSCVILSVMLGLLSVSLLLFQFGLIARGETTWEHLRRERINTAAKLPPDFRPYDHGPVRNCAAFLLGMPLPARPRALGTGSTAVCQRAARPSGRSSTPDSHFGL